jgi:hypothetical protein
MTDVEPQAPMSSLRLDVTLSCDPRYLPMIRQRTVRAVDYLGHHEASRDEVVQAVDLATASVFDPDGPYGDMEVRLATSETDMVVRTVFGCGARWERPRADRAGPLPVRW